MNRKLFVNAVTIGAMLLATLSGSAEAADPLSRIESSADKIEGQLIEIRRRIHMHPERSGEERKTAALVAEQLRELGLSVKTDVGGHGVVGILKGRRPGPVVAYRADMDAVASEVIGDVPYRSKVPGVKHVCGHDAHVAIALGVAHVLTELRDELPGTVKFIFQPAEENVRGARAMIAEGVLEDPRPQAIYAVHTVPFPSGTIACPVGVGLTGWDSFQVRVAAGEETRKVALDANRGIDELSTVEMFQSPEQFQEMMRALLVEDGVYDDFIFLQLDSPTPAEDESGAWIFEGWVRAAGPESYSRARVSIRDILSRLRGDTATVDVTFDEQRFPDMHSDPTLVDAAMGPLRKALGGENVLRMYASAPFFGEDFALFQQQIPGAMFFLGVANPEKGIAALNHFPDYDIDESALRTGTVAMAQVLFDYLRNHLADPH